MSNGSIKLVTLNFWLSGRKWEGFLFLTRWLSISKSVNNVVCLVNKKWMTSCVICCDEAKCVCRYTCVHESVCAHVCFLFRAISFRPKHPADLVSCHCSTSTRSHLRKLSLLQTQQKNLKSVLHTTTHNGSISRHIIPGTKTMIFAPEKVVLMTPNEGAAVWVTPQNSLLATPSCWVSEVYYREPSHHVVMLKTIWTNADLHIIKFRTWFNSTKDNSDIQHALLNHHKGLNLQWLPKTAVKHVWIWVEWTGQTCADLHWNEVMSGGNGNVGFYFSLFTWCWW